MARKPLFFNKIASKKFERKEDAELWAKEQKRLYREAGESIMYTIERNNDQMWEVDLMPLVSDK